MGGRVMDEYIERGTLMRRIKEIHCAECDSYHGVRCRACWVDDTLDYIDSEPAADVAQVRHGRWIDKPLIKSFKHTNIPVVECSACGIDFCDIINNHYFMYKYCPNCGAKMD